MDFQGVFCQSAVSVHKETTSTWNAAKFKSGTVLDFYWHHPATSWSTLVWLVATEKKQKHFNISNLLPQPLHCAPLFFFQCITFCVFLNLSSASKAAHMHNQMDHRHCCRLDCSPWDLTAYKQEPLLLFSFSLENTWPLPLFCCCLTSTLLEVHLFLLFPVPYVTFSVCMSPCFTLLSSCHSFICLCTRPMAAVFQVFVRKVFL